MSPQAAQYPHLLLFSLFSFEFPLRLSCIGTRLIWFVGVFSAVISKSGFGSEPQASALLGWLKQI